MLKISSVKYLVLSVLILSVFLTACSSVTEKSPENEQGLSQNAQRQAAQQQRQLELMQKQQNTLANKVDSNSRVATIPSYDNPNPKKAQQTQPKPVKTQIVQKQQSEAKEQLVAQNAQAVEQVSKKDVNKIEPAEEQKVAVKQIKKVKPTQKAVVKKETKPRPVQNKKPETKSQVVQVKPLPKPEVKKVISEQKDSPVKPKNIESQPVVAEVKSKPAAPAPMMFKRRKAAKKVTAQIDSEEFDYSQDHASSQEIARLGNDLTPVGAEKVGNTDGTIPAWTGGITSPPAGYKVGEHHRDPFADDDVEFVIDSSNYQQYTDKLSEGQLAMFKRYASYKMPVYQTRRSASFPQRIYDKTIENASTGRLTEDGEGVMNVAEGFPFPIPKNGKQLIWNHKLKYKGVSALRYNNQVAPSASGAFTVIKLREELLAPYSKEGNVLKDVKNILLYFYQQVEAPARLAGNVLLVHETINQTEQPRQAWIYNPGQRRVRRAPNVAYDNPGTASDGLRTNDMTDMFNGAMDRFNWKLVGKREMYIPYNSYKAHSDKVDYDDLVRPGHLNPDLMRYELHRVWVVEATLKPGLRHINSRRTFYLDEDSYQIMLVDHYDQRGDLWRFSEAHCINYYELPTFWSTLETHHDLQSGRYITVGIDNQDPVNNFDYKNTPANFTPAALRKRGKR